MQEVQSIADGPPAQKLIRQSRIETTRRVVDAINYSQSDKPTLLISASAIGIYPSSNGLDNNENPSFDEYSLERGENFLAQICTDWESEALRTNSHVRVIITRFGVVISPNPINNSQLTNQLASHYKCPIKVTIPSFIFKAAYGEAAILFTEGQKVIPKRLIDNGYKFSFK